MSSQLCRLFGSPGRNNNNINIINNNNNIQAQVVHCTHYNVTISSQSHISAKNGTIIALCQCSPQKTLHNYHSTQALWMCLKKPLTCHEGAAAQNSSNSSRNMIHLKVWEGWIFLPVVYGRKNMRNKYSTAVSGQIGEKQPPTSHERWLFWVL